MRKFLLPMPDMMIGETEQRAIKDSNKEIIGQKTIIELLYLGGYVKVEVDKSYAETLKQGTVGTAHVEMQPTMSGKSVHSDKGQFTFIDTGFDGFKLIGFEPVKK